MTLLSDSERSVGVDQQNIWANEFDLGHPVLSDNEYALSDWLWPGDTGRPKAVLLGPGAEILLFDVTPEDLPDWL